MATSRFLKLNFFVYVLHVILINCVYSQCPSGLNANISTIEPETYTPESDFEQNPEFFLSQSAVTNDCVGKPGTTIPLNGESGSFGLSKLSDDTGYQFYFKQRGQTGIHATFLQTKESITISSGLRNTLVTTAMLQGCSIYVRRNPKDNTLTIYHHKRSMSDQLGCTPDGCYVVIGGNQEWFDDVYAFEEYNGYAFDDPRGAECDRYRPPGFTLVSLTFVYERSGKWWFLDQKLCYDQRNPIGHFVDLKLIDFKLREIKLQS